MNSRDDEDWEPEEPIPTNQYYVGSEITVSTENGYFTTNQKFKLKNILDVFDESKTEVENMKANGYHRIFDCGNLVFVKNY